MYEYYVYNETRKTYCTIESENLLTIGQWVLISFDNVGIKEKLCKCKVLKQTWKIKL